MTRRNAGALQIALVGLLAAVQVYDTVTCRLLGSMDGHMGHIDAVDWSWDGRLIMTGGEDKTVRVRACVFESTRENKNQVCVCAGGPLAVLEWVTSPSQLSLYGECVCASPACRSAGGTWSPVSAWELRAVTPATWRR